MLYMLLGCASTIIANNIELSVSGGQQTKMPLAILVLNESDDELNTIANTIQKDFQFTDQFKPFIKKYDPHLPKKELRKNMQTLANSGTPLALCLQSQSPKTIDWHLYDTMQCSQLSAKRYKKKGTAIRGWAHTIADETRRILTGSDPLFSSRIAYCKNAKDTQGKIIRKIYIADFDGSNEELLVDLSTIAIAPHWHTQKPELFYSEYTNTSVQLKSVTINKGRKKAVTTGKNVSPFEDGINMHINFAENGQDYAFCASRGNGNCQIYLHKDGNLKRCTKNSGNNDSPIFMDQERLCFCSNFQTGSPQIYIGNIATGHVQRITKGGYCTSPSYCPKTNKIIYHKMIAGTMQLVLYDCHSKTHTELTNDPGNKHAASFSPDGNYILFSHETTRDTSRLASFNVLTNKKKYLGNSHDYYSYPSWSPCYQAFYTVT